MAYDLGMNALGDPTRRAVFERLREGPQAVVDLAATLPVSRPAVSQHLKVLKDAGLVHERRDGARRIYGVAPEGLAELRLYFERFWTDALAGFKAVAEQGEVRDGIRTDWADPDRDGGERPTHSRLGGLHRADGELVAARDPLGLR
jgi:DNA-binding transcriptional ArsR family regulator